MKLNTVIGIISVTEFVNVILLLLLDSFFVALLITIIILVLFSLPIYSFISILVFLTGLFSPVVLWLYKKYGKKYWITTFKGTAAIFALIGVILMFLSYNTHLMDNVTWDPIILSLGIGVFSLGMAGLALAISRESSYRMQAMANLEFYDKIAVIETYICIIKEGKEIAIETIYNDIMAAKQLNNYVSPEIRQKLYDKIQELIDKAQRHPHRADLVKRLQDLLLDGY